MLEAAYQTKKKLSNLSNLGSLSSSVIKIDTQPKQTRYSSACSSTTASGNATTSASGNATTTNTTADAAFAAAAFDAFDTHGNGSVDTHGSGSVDISIIDRYDALFTDLERKFLKHHTNWLS